MNGHPDPGSEAADLRRRAEALWSTQTRGAEAASVDEARRQIRELQIHQLELELERADRLAVEARLQAALEEQAAALELASPAYLTLGVDGTIRQANGAAQDLLGWHDLPPLPVTFADRLVPEDRGRFEALLTRIFQSRVRATDEVRLIRPRPPPGRMRVHGRVAADGLEARLVLQDLGDCSGVQAALRESEVQLRAIAAHTPDHVVIQDRELRYRRVINPQLGLTEAEMLGKTDRELADRLGPEAAERLMVLKQGVLARGEAVPFETSLHNSKGEFESFEGTYVPLFAAGGGVEGLIGYVRNTTSQRRLDRVLEARVRLSEYALGHSLDELLTRTLDEAELLTGSRIGFFHFVDADQRTLSLQTWSTNTLTHMCTAEGKHRHYPVDQAGVWVDALRERRPVIHNDYAGLPHRRGLPPGHAPVERELVVPVLRHDLVVALLGVGNKPAGYEPPDIESVSCLANLAWDVVRAKREEEATARLAREWQVTFDATNDAIWLLDPDQRVIRANRMADRLFPRGLAGKGGGHCWEIVHGTPGPIPNCPVERARRSLQRETMELPFGDAWYEVIADPILDEAGRYTGAVHILADITERVRAEEALRESEERFRVAQDLSLHGFTILASVRDGQGQIVDFRCLYANREAGRLLHHPPESLVGCRLLELLPGSRDHEALFHRYVRIVETRAGDEVELEYRSEGITGWFRNMAVPLGDGVAVSFSDITAHRQAEATLREKNAELEAALATVRSLSGLLPICASCKKIRDDRGYWNQVEMYIEKHSHARFTHGLCPECVKKFFPNLPPSDHS